TSVRISEVADHDTNIIASSFDGDSVHKIKLAYKDDYDVNKDALYKVTLGKSNINLVSTETFKGGSTDSSEYAFYDLKLSHGSKDNNKDVHAYNIFDVDLSGGIKDHSIDYDFDGLGEDLTLSLGSDSKITLANGESIDIIDAEKIVMPTGAGNEIVINISKTVSNNINIASIASDFDSNGVINLLGGALLSKEGIHKVIVNGDHEVAISGISKYISEKSNKFIINDEEVTREYSFKVSEKEEGSKSYISYAGLDKVYSVNIDLSVDNEVNNFKLSIGDQTTRDGGKVEHKINNINTVIIDSQIEVEKFTVNQVSGIANVIHKNLDKKYNATISYTQQASNAIKQVVLEEKDATKLDDLGFNEVSYDGTVYDVTIGDGSNKVSYENIFKYDFTNEKDSSNIELNMTALTGPSEVNLLEGTFEYREVGFEFNNLDTILLGSGANKLILSSDMSKNVGNKTLTLIDGGSSGKNIVQFDQDHAIVGGFANLFSGDEQIELKNFQIIGLTKYNDVLTAENTKNVFESSYQFDAVDGVSTVSYNLLTEEKKLSYELGYYEDAKSSLQLTVNKEGSKTVSDTLINFAKVELGQYNDFTFKVGALYDSSKELTEGEVIDAKDNYFQVVNTNSIQKTSKHEVDYSGYPNVEDLSVSIDIAKYDPDSSYDKDKATEIDRVSLLVAVKDTKISNTIIYSNVLNYNFGAAGANDKDGVDLTTKYDNNTELKLNEGILEITNNSVIAGAAETYEMKVTNIDTMDFAGDVTVVVSDNNEKLSKLTEVKTQSKGTVNYAGISKGVSGDIDKLTTTQGEIELSGFTKIIGSTHDDEFIQKSDNYKKYYEITEDQGSNTYDYGSIKEESFKVELIDKTAEEAAKIKVHKGDIFDLIENGSSDTTLKLGAGGDIDLSVANSIKDGYSNTVIMSDLIKIHVSANAINTIIPENKVSKYKGNEANNAYKLNTVTYKGSSINKISKIEVGKNFVTDVYSTGDAKVATYDNFYEFKIEGATSGDKVELSFENIDSDIDVNLEDASFNLESKVMFMSGVTSIVLGAGNNKVIIPQSNLYNPYLSEIDGGAGENTVVFERDAAIIADIDKIALNSEGNAIKLINFKVIGLTKFDDVITVDNTNYNHNYSLDGIEGNNTVDYFKLTEAKAIVTLDAYEKETKLLVDIDAGKYTHTFINFNKAKVGSHYNNAQVNINKIVDDFTFKLGGHYAKISFDNYQADDIAKIKYNTRLDIKIITEEDKTLTFDRLFFSTFTVDSDNIVSPVKLDLISTDVSSPSRFNTFLNKIASITGDIDIYESSKEEITITIPDEYITAHSDVALKHIVYKSDVPNVNLHFSANNIRTATFDDKILLETDNTNVDITNLQGVLTINPNNSNGSTLVMIMKSLEKGYNASISKTNAIVDYSELNSSHDVVYEFTNKELQVFKEYLDGGETKTSIDTIQHYEGVDDDTREVQNHEVDYIHKRRVSFWFEGCI
ncbi:hypothetical protein SNEBB_007381, partial [Seison nebaliae]